MNTGGIGEEVFITDGEEAAGHRSPLGSASSSLRLPETSQAYVATSAQTGADPAALDL